MCNLLWVADFMFAKLHGLQKSALYACLMLRMNVTNNYSLYPQITKPLNVIQIVLILISIILILILGVAM